MRLQQDEIFQEHTEYPHDPAANCSESELHCVVEAPHTPTLALLASAMTSFDY